MVCGIIIDEGKLRLLTACMQSPLTLQVQVQSPAEEVGGLGVRIASVNTGFKNFKYHYTSSSGSGLELRARSQYERYR